MPPLRTTLRRLVALLTLAAWALACGPDVGVGTPTPEPPDLLPRPEIRTVHLGSFPGSAPDAPVDVLAEPGSVLPSSDVWITNLDDAALRAPVVTTAGVDGSFAAKVEAALGDRIRFVARLGSRHSLPQDLTVVMDGQVRSLTPAVAEDLPCLALAPREDLTIVVTPDGANRGVVTLINDCTEPVFLEHASLRLGGGYKYALPDELPPGGRAALTVTSSDNAQSERGDVLLLELATSDARGRYAIGLWSISTVSRGKR